VGAGGEASRGGEAARAAHCKALALEPNSAGNSAATSGFTRTRTRSLASRIFSRRNISARKVLNLSSRMGSSVPSRSCPPRTPRGAWPAAIAGDDFVDWRSFRAGDLVQERNRRHRIARRPSPSHWGLACCEGTETITRTAGVISLASGFGALGRHTYSCSSAIMLATKALQPVWWDAPRPRPLSPSKYSWKRM
jgi:hypothetical protein